MMLKAVPFSRERLDDLLSLVSKTARGRLPGAPYLLNSDMAWRLPGSDPKNNLRLWYAEDDVVGYGWFMSAGPSCFDVAPDIPSIDDLVSEILTWLEDRYRALGPYNPWLLDLRSMADWQDALRQGAPAQLGDECLVQVECLDDDAVRTMILEQAGFRKTDHFQFNFLRGLEDIDKPNLAAGWAIRAVKDNELEARVALHRASWFGSTYSLEQYQAMRAIPAYDPDLDLVAVSPSGDFASYCIGWIDHDLKVGSFEPVGTPPDYRGMGLARAVNAAALKVMRKKGATLAKVGTAGFNDPAHNLYKSCGFYEVAALRTWVRPLENAKDQPVQARGLVS